VTTQYESPIDRQIREAQERGDFDDLPGLGKPLPGYGQGYDEDWWIKDWIRRENITGVLPTSLRLRRESEDLMRTVAKKSTEASVRRFVTDLNDRIRQAQRGLVDGPPVVLRVFDVDEVVQAWRERRA
jgi:hypothetical protein